MNQRELLELLELISKKRIAEFELERSGFKLKVKTVYGGHSVSEDAVESVTMTEATPPPESPAQPVIEIPQPVPPPPAQPPAPPTNAFIVRAEIVGTFYRAPSPQSPAFVEVGSKVKPGTVLCIIEAMKLMNEIESEIGGEVVEIYVENGKPVEYGQPLFAVRRDG